MRCPSPEWVLGAPIRQRFSQYVDQHFPMLRGDRSLGGADRGILVGCALGHQALAAGDDPVRRDAFDCLLIALDQATYWQAIASGPNRFGPSEMDAYRDGLLADGLGPDYGPNGGGCPPEPGATPDYYYAVVPWPHEACYTFGDTVWCCGNDCWTSVVRTDGSSWALAAFRGGVGAAARAVVL